MGRIPLPGPFFSSSVAATLAARALGASELLTDLAAGTRRGTVALGEQGHGDPVSTVRTRARREGGPVGRDRREAGRGRRAHGGLGHRGGAQRGGGAVVPPRVARGRLGPVARSHPQAGPARARRHAGHPAGPVGQPAGPVATGAGRHRRRVGGGDRRRRRPGPGRGHRLHVGADRLRQARRHLPDGAPPAGRDVPAGRDGPGRLPVRRLGLGHGVARAGTGRGHGRELRGGRRRAGDRGRHPAARGRRVHLGQRRPLPLQAGEAERAPRRAAPAPSATGWRRSSSNRHDHLRVAPDAGRAGRALPGRGRLGRPHARGVPARRPPGGPDAALPHLVADAPVPRDRRRGLRGVAARGRRAARARARAGRRRGLPVAQLGRGGHHLLRLHHARRDVGADRALLRSQGARLHPPPERRPCAGHRVAHRSARLPGRPGHGARRAGEPRARRGGGRHRRRRVRVRRASTTCARRSPIDGPAHVDPDGAAVIGYTSGTTADPKGVVHTHRTLGCEVRQLADHQAMRDLPSLVGAPGRPCHRDAGRPALPARTAGGPST